jgi:hypothetical protein
MLCLLLPRVGQAHTTTKAQHPVQQLALEFIFPNVQNAAATTISSASALPLHVDRSTESETAK